MRARFSIIIAAPLLLACAIGVSTPLLAQNELPPGISPKGEAKNFDEHVARINASDKFLAAYAELEDDHPVINLNLLQFRPRGNGDRYGMYGKIASKEIEAVRGGIVGAGLVITDASAIYGFSEEWDEIAFALYPRKRAYLALQEDDDYQLAIPDRVAGTYRRMLYAISDGQTIYNARDSIADYHESDKVLSLKNGNFILAEFLRFKKDGGRRQYTKFAKAFQPLLEAVGGHVALSVDAEFPIVSREYWDHFVTFVFPSRKVMEDLLTSDDFLVANKDRIQSLAGNMSVAAKAVIAGSE